MIGWEDDRVTTDQVQSKMLCYPYRVSANLTSSGTAAMATAGHSSSGGVVANSFRRTRAEQLPCSQGLQSNVAVQTLQSTHQTALTTYVQFISFILRGNYVDYRLLLPDTVSDRLLLSTSSWCGLVV